MIKYYKYIYFLWQKVGASYAYLRKEQSTLFSSRRKSNNIQRNKIYNIYTYNINFIVI